MSHTTNFLTPTWRVLAVVGVLLVLGGCGRAPTENTQTEPTGPRVREAATEARAGLEALGYDVRSFRFAGGLVDAWIEVEQGGKTRRLAGGLHEEVGHMLRAGGHRIDPRAARGSITWARREVNGTAVWGLAVAVEDARGEPLAASGRKDLDPALPRAAVVSEGPPGTPRSGWLALKPDEEVTLYAVRYAGDGEPATTYRLKCKPGELRPE
jgi:hypothetical protein